MTDSRLYNDMKQARLVLDMVSLAAMVTVYSATHEKMRGCLTCYFAYCFDEFNKKIKIYYLVKCNCTMYFEFLSIYIPLRSRKSVTDQAIHAYGRKCVQITL